MKRLFCFFGICAVLVGLYLTSPLNGVRLLFPSVPTVVQTQNGVLKGDAWTVMNLPAEFCTATLSPDDYSSLLRLLAPEYYRIYTVEGIEMTEGYSPGLTNNVTVNGKRQNFQIAKKSDLMLLGLPTITGGY